jgi:glyoxylase-like metal-dependent hydrolase (beta-lactamase superfamily II)
MADGQAIEVGHCRLTMLETPGHYPDCVCWHHEEGGLLFSGDTVFVNRTGRTIGPLSNTRQLYHSVYNQIMTLPRDTTVYPGHNYGPIPSITLGELKASSDFFSCASAAQFEEVMARFERSRQRGE